jgi:hypothetical protein
MCVSAAIAGSATAPQSAGRLPADYDTAPLPPNIRTRIVAAAVTPKVNRGTGNASAPALKK